jgi:hypothetical protein
VLTGITPIVIKAGEIAKLYRITRHGQNSQLEHEVEQKDWTHPADLVRISEKGKEKKHRI